MNPAIDTQLETISNRSLIDWMKSLIHQVDSNSLQSAKDDLIRICTREAQAFSTRRGNDGVSDGPSEDLVRQCIKACEVLGNNALLSKIAEGCAGQDLSPGVYESFVETLHTFDFLRVEPSLDLLLSRGRFLYPRLHMIDSFRRQHQSMRLNGLSPAKAQQYELWEKATIVELLGTVEDAVGEDALPLARVVERYGRSFSNQRVLPFLEHNTSKTNLVVGFLAEISKGVRDGHIPDRTGNHFLDALLRPTVAKLSIKDFRSKEDTKAPFWYECPKVEEALGAHLGEKVACLYCLCKAQGLEAEASSILTWLKQEADIACVSTFPYLFVPFLNSLRSHLTTHDVAVSPAIREACVYLAFHLHARCIGDEPIRTSNWTRAPKGCKNQECTLCPQLRKFLAHPRREAQIFNDNTEGHLRRQANYPLKTTKLKGSTKLKIQKTDYMFEAEHKKWQLRFDGVRAKLRPLEEMRPLFGTWFPELRRLFRA